MTPISKDADFKHPEDGMYMIEPVGEHLEREGRVMEVIDSAAVVSIVENFNAAAQAENFSGLLVDHEHFKHDLQKETIAYGWLMGLQGRADGIYGQIRWTATGQAAVDGGDYRDAAALLAEPPKQWQAPLPLDKIANAHIESARKLREALWPWLVQQHDLSLTAAEREAGGTADYFRIFHSRISPRYWRELLARTLRRDAGAEDWNRLEIYLPERPAAKEAAARMVTAALAEEFGAVESFINACGNPAAPSKTEQRAVWTLALEKYASLVSSGMPDKQAARRVRSFLFAKAPFLASTRDALLKAFDRKREALEHSAGDPKALRDGREQNGDRFDLPADDRDRLIHRAVFYYRGDVVPAWRDLLKSGFSEPVRERYFGKAASKSHVPTSVKDSVSSEVEILTVMHQGPRAYDSIKGYVDRSYEGIASLKCMSADDFTMPVYYYVPDGKGWFVLTRGQILIFTDFRALRILGWSMQPDRNYSSLTIRSLCTHVFAEHGVPSVLQFERGIWESSSLIKGRDPAPFEFTEVVQGLREFGIRFIHSIRPRSKTVKRIGGLVQDLMEAEPGYCGRNERVDAPETLRKQMAEVEARKVHPSRYFYSYEDWHRRFGEIVNQYNAAPQQGRILCGMSPDEALAKLADTDDPPMQFSAGLRYLLAHDKRPAKVTLNGVTFQVGRQKFNYRGKEIAHLVGQDVLAWFDPENPETLTVTDMQRRNPICVARAHEVSALECVTDPDSGRLAQELRRVAAQGSYMKARFTAVKSKFPMPQRVAIADAHTAQLGQEFDHLKTAQKEKTVRVDRMRRQANRLDIPAVMVDDDPETQRGLELMAEAEREHQRGQKEAKVYQLDPTKQFNPKGNES
jgi:hypothetical protein